MGRKIRDMVTPVVSIIIPCYKQAEYLADAIDSVLSQTFANWECVVVNDASPDHTSAVALSFVKQDARIRLIELDKNGGLANARNRGIAATSGTYIVPLDADDTLHPFFLETVLRKIVTNERLKVVYTDVREFGLINQVAIRKDFDWKLMARQNLFQAIAIFRRSDFERTAGYRVKVAYEDWDLWLQLIDRNDQAIRVPLPLVNVRVKEQSMIKDIQGQPEIEKEIRKEIYFLNRKKFQAIVPELAFSFERKSKNPDIAFLIHYWFQRFRLRMKVFFQ